MNSKQLLKRKNKRKRCKWAYAILSAITYGIGLIVIHYFASILLNVLSITKDAEPPSIVFFATVFVFWVTLLIPINLLTWNKNEKEFREHAEIAQ